MIQLLTEQLRVTLTHDLVINNLAIPEQDDAVSICRQVRSMIAQEGIILDLIGSLLGIAGGIYLGYVGSMAMQTLGYPMEYAFPLGAVLAALLVGLVFSILSSGLPSRQAARMNVVGALCNE